MYISKELFEIKRTEEGTGVFSYSNQYRMKIKRHMLVGYFICEIVEQGLFPKP